MNMTSCWDQDNSLGVGVFQTGSPNKIRLMVSPPKVLPDVDRPVEATDKTSKYSAMATKILPEDGAEGTSEKRVLGSVSNLMAEKVITSSSSEESEQPESAREKPAAGSKYAAIGDKFKSAVLEDTDANEVANSVLAALAEQILGSDEQQQQEKYSNKPKGSKYLKNSIHPPSDSEHEPEQKEPAECKTTKKSKYLKHIVDLSADEEGELTLQDLMSASARSLGPGSAQAREAIQNSISNNLSANDLQGQSLPNMMFSLPPIKGMDAPRGNSPKLKISLSRGHQSLQEGNLSSVDLRTKASKSDEDKEEKDSDDIDIDIDSDVDMNSDDKKGSKKRIGRNNKTRSGKEAPKNGFPERSSKNRDGPGFQRSVNYPETGSDGKRLTRRDKVLARKNAGRVSTGTRCHRVKSAEGQLEPSAAEGAPDNSSLEERPVKVVSDEEEASAEATTDESDAPARHASRRGRARVRAGVALAQLQQIKDCPRRPSNTVPNSTARSNQHQVDEPETQAVDHTIPVATNPQHHAPSRPTTKKLRAKRDVTEKSFASIPYEPQFGDLYDGDPNDAFICFEYGSGLHNSKQELPEEEDDTSHISP
jgi:hypothetical protein